MVSRRELLASGLACSVPAWAQGSGNRVALVIGNAAYAAAPLPNAAKDAQAMSAALRGMGFEVIEVRDAGKKRMEEAITLSRALLQGRNGVGLLYYAGHGLQVDWRNYMVPVDAEMASAADVPKAAVDIQGAIDAFRAAGNRMNIVVLDACRDNPFGNAATGKGLAPLDAPPGTYLAYATAPGNYAEDGDAASGNGLYTGFLLKELQRPDAKIEEIFRRVRFQVRQASKGRQVPWDMSSLEDEFVFQTGRKAAEPGRPEQEARELAMRDEWAQIKDSTDVAAFYAFLQRHPGGSVSELAAARIEALDAVKLVAVARPNDWVVPPVRRYAVGDTLVYQNYEVAVSRVPTSQTVERVIETGPRGTLMTPHTQLDSSGVTVAQGGRIFVPGYLELVVEPALGKRWTSSYDSLNRKSGVLVNRRYAHHVIAAIEDVEVPAGRFSTFRVDVSGDEIRMSGWGVTRTYRETHWFDRRTLIPVRSETRLIQYGTLLLSYGRELVSMQVA